MARTYFLETPIEDLVDNFGDHVLFPEEIDALKLAGFETMEDLLYEKVSLYDVQILRPDFKAMRAQEILVGVSEQSNSLQFRIEDLYPAWRADIYTDKVRKHDEAASTVPLSVTAPVGRNSRITRVFALIQPNEILDLVDLGGTKSNRPCDRGYAGVSSDPDDFGYNG